RWQRSGSSAWEQWAAGSRAGLPAPVTTSSSGTATVLKLSRLRSAVPSLRRGPRAWVRGAGRGSTWGAAPRGPPPRAAARGGARGRSGGGRRGGDDRDPDVDGRPGLDGASRLSARQGGVARFAGARLHLGGRVRDSRGFRGRGAGPFRALAATALDPRHRSS